MNGRVFYVFLLCASGVCHAQGSPKNFQELLNQNAAKPLRVLDGRGAHEGHIQTVGADFFCGQFGEMVRCYRFDAIRWVAVKSPGPEVLIVSVPEF